MTSLLALIMTLSVISSMLALGTARLFTSALQAGSYLETEYKKLEAQRTGVDYARTVDYKNLEKGTIAFTVGGFKNNFVISDGTFAGGKCKLIKFSLGDYPAEPPIYIKRIAGQTSGMPIGAIMAFPSDVAPKTGGVWLPCDGKTDITSYPVLQNILSGMATTPNLSDHYLRGYGCSHWDTSIHRWRYQSGKLLETQQWQEQNLNKDPVTNEDDAATRSPSSNRYEIFVPQVVLSGKLKNGFGAGYWDKARSESLGYHSTQAFYYRETAEMWETAFDTNNKQYSNAVMGLELYLSSADMWPGNTNYSEFRPDTRTVIYFIKAQ